MEESGQEGAEEPQRAYRNERVAVQWNPDRCVRSEWRMRGLPWVFQPDARSWARADVATAYAIAAVVARGPSGAPHVERLNGGAGEEPGEITTIEPQPNGPHLSAGVRAYCGHSRECAQGALPLRAFAQHAIYDRSDEAAGFQA
jgi:uncharacterized Fe-S cluster protein YjdI